MPRQFACGFCLLLACAVGCEETVNPPDAATRTTAPPAAVSSEDATGVWTRTQVEQYVKENLKLKTVSLQSAGGDNYSGMGTAQDGRVVNLKIRQVPGGIRCEYEDDRGGTGSIAFGNAVPGDGD